ncbi:MAG: hypothetical protein WC868_10860 [Bacteroidales bacterium]
MKYQNDISAIHCSRYEESFAAMNIIKQKINNVASVLIKAEYAEELSDKVNSLIKCPEYTNQRQDCINCRMIANLHKRSAEIIIKAKSLSR